MDNPLLIAAPGGVMILLLVGLLVALRLRVRSAAPADPDDSVSSEDPEAPLDDSGSADSQTIDHLDPTPDVVQVEAVDHPVELLEGPVAMRTLGSPLDMVVQPLEPALEVLGSGADVARFRRQVTAALSGVRERTDGNEPPERTLARVAAAIERLDTPDQVVRPLLPAVKFDISGAPLTIAGPQRVPPPALQAARSVSMGAPGHVAPVEDDPSASAPRIRNAAPTRPIVTTPLASAIADGALEYDLAGHDLPGQPGLSVRDRPGPGPIATPQVDPFADDEHAWSPTAEPDVVLPVPPPVAAAERRPRRRSFRRGA